MIRSPMRSLPTLKMSSCLLKASTTWHQFSTNSRMSRRIDLMKGVLRVSLQLWSKECPGKSKKRIFTNKVLLAILGLLFGNSISVWTQERLSRLFITSVLEAKCTMSWPSLSIKRPTDWRNLAASEKSTMPMWWATMRHRPKWSYSTPSLTIRTISMRISLRQMTLKDLL